MSYPQFRVLIVSIRWFPTSCPQGYPQGNEPKPGARSAALGERSARVGGAVVVKKKGGGTPPSLPLLRESEPEKCS